MIKVKAFGNPNDQHVPISDYFSKIFDHMFNL